MGADIFSVSRFYCYGPPLEKVVAQSIAALPSMCAPGAILFRPAWAGPAGLRARAGGPGETCPKVIALDFLTFSKGVSEAARSLWAGLAKNRFCFLFTISSQRGAHFFGQSVQIEKFSRVSECLDF